jgi:DNA-binding transcriptional LysR family regulator
MDRRQLLAFATLAEELSFSRAAARLGMTQPALSMLIAKLEGDLDVPLFDRSRRAVSLTGPGKVFWGEVRQTLRQMDLAERMVRRAAEGKLGRLTIGFVETAPFNILPTVVAGVRKHLPHIELVLQELVTMEQIEALEAGRIDVGLMRPMFRAGQFDSRLISSEPYMVAVNANHALAGRGKVRLKDLQSEPLITTESRKRRYVEGRFRGPLARAGIELPIAHEIQQIHAIIGLVAGGLGIALVPRSVKVIAIPNVRFLDIDEPRPPTSELALATRKGDDNPVVKRFRSILDPVMGCFEETCEPKPTRSR